MGGSEAPLVTGTSRRDAAVPRGATSIRAALVAEWIKLSTIPHALVYGTAAVVLGAGWAGAGTYLSRTEFLAAIAERDDAIALSSMMWLGVTRFTIVVAMVLGATLLTSERETGTAVMTRIVLPHPAAVYGAKVAWAGAIGLVVGVIAGLAVPLAVRMMLGPAATGFTVLPSLSVGYGVRVAIVTGLCATAGVALGALTRSLLLTAAIAFVWVMFENTVASMTGDFANLYVLTPWRNLTYFIDGSGFDLPYLWDAIWGFAPLAALTVILVLAGALRHCRDTHTIKE